MQQLSVLFGPLAACFRPFIHIFEFYAQDRRLNRVESTVYADLRVLVLSSASVHAKGSQPVRQLIVISRNDAAVPGAAEILCRIETESPQQAHRACPTPVVFRTYCLGGILDDRNLTPLADFLQRFHLSALPVHMDG